MIHHDLFLCDFYKSSQCKANHDDSLKRCILLAKTLYVPIKFNYMNQLTLNQLLTIKAKKDMAMKPLRNMHIST